MHRCISERIFGVRGDPYIGEVAIQMMIPPLVVLVFTSIFYIARARNAGYISEIALFSGCCKGATFFINYFHPSISASLFRLYQCDS